MQQRERGSFVLPAARPTEETVNLELLVGLEKLYTEVLRLMRDHVFDSLFNKCTEWWDATAAANFSSASEALHRFANPDLVWRCRDEVGTRAGERAETGVAGHSGGTVLGTPIRPRASGHKAGRARPLRGGRLSRALTRHVRSHGRPPELPNVRAENPRKADDRRNRKRTLNISPCGIEVAQGARRDPWLQTH